MWYIWDSFRAHTCIRWVYFAINTSQRDISLLITCSDEYHCGKVIFQSFHCEPWKWCASWKWELVKIRFWTFVSFFWPQAASLKAFLTLPQATAGHPEPLCLRLRAPPASHHSWGIYSPMSGGSETLLYRLRAPPLTHRSWGTHPPKRWAELNFPRVSNSASPIPYTFDTLVTGMVMSGGRRCGAASASAAV